MSQDVTFGNCGKSINKIFCLFSICERLIESITQPSGKAASQKILGKKPTEMTRNSFLDLVDI